MNARSFPRTLAQAFGPYTDNRLHEPPKAVFDAWIKWRQAHAKPDTQESYQADQIAEHNCRPIPGNY